MIVKWLKRILLCAIVLVSFRASILNSIETKDLGQINDDPVMDWEKRFEPLKARLPFVRGIIGYIDDADVPGADYNTADEQGEYVLVQYSLAPIIIVKGLDQEWNVGNFSRKAYKIWAKSNHGQFEVFPFKGNLYLIHRLNK